MLIEVTVDYLPYLGVRGTQKEVPDGQARILIRLNKAKAVEGVRSTRRIYQRRDMAAETSEAPAPIEEPVVDEPDEPEPPPARARRSMKRKHVDRENSE